MRNRLTHLSMENSSKTDSDDDGDKSGIQLLQLKIMALKFILKLNQIRSKLFMAPTLKQIFKNKKQYARRHLLKLHEQHTTDTQGLAQKKFARGMYLVGGGAAKKFARSAEIFFGTPNGVKTFDIP